MNNLPNHSDLLALGYSHREARNFLSTLADNPVSPAMAWRMARYEGVEEVRPVPAHLSYLAPHRE